MISSPYVRYPDPAAIFIGVAEHYVRHRPAHPSPLVDYVTGLARRSGGSAPVLDLGCGPGVLALPLAEAGLQVLAVDPNQEMLDAGRAKACEQGIADIQWRQGDSTTLPGLPSISGAVIGDAFHYMDRGQTLADLDGLILPGGFVAVVVSYALGTEKAWWEPVLDRIRDCTLGEHRAAGPGTPFQYPAEDHETVMRRSPFCRLHTLRVDRQLNYTLEELVGLQYTYAFSSPAVLGDRREEFASTVRAALAAIEPSERFTATVQAAVIVGERP